MDEFKKVTKEQAEQFAALFFGAKVNMVDSPLNEFTFKQGVVTLKVFNNYGRKGETSYPFEHPFGQVAVNGYVVAGVLCVKDKSEYRIESITEKAG